MHTIEPYFAWLDLYNSENDPRSPFYERFHSEFEYSNTVYNYYLHPQWDDMGSPTLFLRIIYCDYEKRYAIIELIGEWNDAINNDIMMLKRDVIDLLAEEGINHYILIGENVLNFHGFEDDYYAEWFDDVNDSDGWMAMVNFRPHVTKEMEQLGIDQYFLTGGEIDVLEWRTYSPPQLYKKINQLYQQRLQ